MTQHGAVKIQEPRHWLRWVLWVWGALFLLAAPLNLSNADYANAAFGALLGALALGGGFVLHQAQTARNELLQWLADNADAIRRGTAVWQGQRVTPETTMRCFDTTISMLVFTSKFPSRFVLEGDSARTGIMLLSTLSTLLLGWWGIPFGPIYTVMSVYRNLRGGHVVRVEELLEDFGL